MEVVSSRCRPGSDSHEGQGVADASLKAVFQIKASHIVEFEQDGPIYADYPPPAPVRKNLASPRCRGGLVGMLYDPTKLLVIAGPCSLENETVCRAVASRLTEIARALPELRIVFKGSFDKANRTSIAGPRGTGIDEGLKLLALVKRDYGFPVLTDIHDADQCARVAEVCDVLQIPAFLCRQTDILLAAAATGRVVNVKKGQFLAPQDMVHVTGKLREGRAAEIWQTERGTTFGYQNLVVDMRSFPIMARNGYPVILDATHSVQLPGGGGGKSSGQREFVPPLALAALAAGADGLFLETHPDPANALSDGPNMVPLDELQALLTQCHAVWRCVRG
nr:3-deoxy-8-phosphooctulonate synthase [Geminisphaera colitermitum]